VPRGSALPRALLASAAILAAVSLVVFLITRTPPPGDRRSQDAVAPSPADAGKTAATRASGRPGLSDTAAPPAPAAAAAAAAPAGAGAIEGRALDADTGTGMGGVDVVAFARGFERATRTEADGRFVIEPVPGGRVVVIAFPEDCEDATETFELGAAERRQVTFALRAGAAVTGVITGPRGPVAGATVLVQAAGDPPKPLLRAREARADEAGRYRVAGLPPGRAILVARAPGLAPPAIEREVDAPRGPPSRADFEFGEGATIEGRVLDEGGAGLPGATVAVEVEGVFDPYETTTGEAGAYRIGGLPGASARVLARRAGHAPGESPLLPLTAGEVLRGVDIALARGARVEGRVVLPNGSAAGRAKVTLLDRDARIAGTAGAGPDGRFAFEDVRSGGSYRLTASFPGHLDAESPFVLVMAGPVPLEVTLELGRGAGGIFGRVVDAEGRPVPGARVETPRPADPERRMHAIADDEGLFLIEGLLPGLRDLYLVDPETGEETVHRAVVEERLPPTPLVLRLAPGGAAPAGAVLVVSLPRGIVERAAVLVFPEDAGPAATVGAALGRDGLFRATGLAPGKRHRVLVLTGASDRPLAARTIDLVEGENHLEVDAPDRGP
jgi:hypothetical protein